jgi:hypothetical protein
MEHDRDRWLDMHKPAIDFDMIALVRLGAEISADLTVDGNAAGGDKFVAVTARTDSGSGEITIQAHIAPLREKRLSI